MVTGTVDPEATTYHFEYGTSASYGVVTPDARRGRRRTRRVQTLTNLTSSTTYHYRVVLRGGVQGADRTFTPAHPPRAPSVSSLSATGSIATGRTCARV